MNIRKYTGSINELKVPEGTADETSIAASDEPDLDYRKKIKYGNRIQVKTVGFLNCIIQFAAWALIVEFCSNSSVHGIRYFSERSRHWSERIWWIIAFGLSAYFCGTLIRNVWIKWDQSPVIVSFAEKSTPVWAIPFPAVTICPETKTYMDKLNFTETFNALKENLTANVSDDALKRMEAVIQLCDAHIATDNFQIGTEHSNGTLFDVIQDIAPTYNDTMFFCKWRNEVNFCNAFFQTILTEEGVCYTFNALNSRDIYTDEMAPEMMSVNDNQNATDWNLEDGYNDSGRNVTETYPYRVFGAGARAGLFALLRLYEQDLEYLCRGPVQGFKILLHTPGEIPQVSKHYFRVPLLQEVLVSVKPNMITTSEGLRHYEPNRRQCYFNSERQLRFFKVYTQRNCELECLSNFTKNECGCVKFSLPRDKDTPICGATKIKCYNEAEDKLLEKFFVEGLSNTEAARKGCNCLPSCTSITYDAEISQAKFDWVSLFIAFKNPLDEFPGMQPARLSIYFKEHQFITSKRSELYGMTDFLANCGGLLGLFMGVSVLSIIEVIYYFTLRLGCSLRLRRHRQRKSIRISKNTVAPIDHHIPNIMVVKPERSKDHLN